MVRKVGLRVVRIERVLFDDWLSFGDRGTVAGCGKGGPTPLPCLSIPGPRPGAETTGRSGCSQWLSSVRLASVFAADLPLRWAFALSGPFFVHESDEPALIHISNGDMHQSQRCPSRKFEILFPAQCDSQRYFEISLCSAPNYPNRPPLQLLQAVPHP